MSNNKCKNHEVSFTMINLAKSVLTENINAIHSDLLSKVMLLLPNESINAVEAEDLLYHLRCGVKV